MTHLTKFGRRVILLGLLPVVVLFTAALAAVVASQENTSTVYYGLDRAEIQPEAAATLRDLARKLRATPGATVSISGHTCSLGGHDYNLELSRRRAEAAADYLVRHENIPAARLQVAWYGPDRPALANLNVFNRRRNRRVELIFAATGTGQLSSVPSTAGTPVAADSAKPAAAMPAAGPKEVERTVSAAVLGRNGQPLTGLPPEAFAVSEGGAPRSIVSVREGGDRARGSAALLLDHSGSMCLVDLREATRQFSLLMPGDARLTLATVDDRLTIIDDRATRATLAYQADILTRGGRTHLYDALLQLITTDLATQPGPRVLVIFTDGMDEGGLAGRAGSVNPLAAVIAAAQRHDIRIAAVELGPTFAPGSASLKRLARESGGVYVVYDNNLDARQFAPVWDLLGVAMPSGMYTITYRAPEGAPAPVRVSSPVGRVTDVFPQR